MMVLYSGTTDPYSHRCRFVLFEKGMDFEIRDVDLFAKPEDIALMNPYNEVPILVERDLILYESHIINEYIDERQYDEAVGDLVAYLQWMGEPAQGTRIRIGVGVLVFLGLLVLITWRLSSAYWRTVH